MSLEVQCSTQVLWLGPSLLDECDQEGRDNKGSQTGMTQEQHLSSSSMIYQGIYSEKYTYKYSVWQSKIT